MRHKINPLEQIGEFEKKDLKFVFYSMHDNQIIWVLDFLKPANFTINKIPFASTIFIELYFDSST